MPQRRPGTEFAIVFGGCALVTVAMTMPLWLHPARQLPSDLIDTLLNTWIIGWDADRLRHGLHGWWTSPAFFPYRSTLTFSENLLGVALFVAPIYWATGNPVLTYNAALLLSFAFAGATMYLLARRLTGNRGAACVAATAFAFCSFRFVHLRHIQLVATGWLPLALYAEHKYFDTRRRKWLALFSLACVFQILSNLYVAYFMLLPIAVVAVAELWRNRTGRVRAIVDLAAAAVLVVGALAPIAWKYYDARTAYHQVRRLDEMDLWSADVQSYVRGSSSVGVWRWLRAGKPFDDEHDLFPGFTVLALATTAIVFAASDRDRRRWIWIYGGVAVGAAVLSLGPHPRAWGHPLMSSGPYAWLVAIIPGLDGLRVPARFAIIVALALAVLAGFGAAAVSSRIPGRVRLPAAVLCIVALLGDSWVAPLTIYRYGARGRPTDRAVADWLQTRPPGGVLHQPVKTWNYQELSYQFATLAHQHPIVNGISGYDTPLQILFRDRTSVLYDSSRPADVVRMLRALGIRFVIVNMGDFSSQQVADHDDVAALQLLRASGQIVEERHMLDAFAFELQPPIAAPAATPLARVEAPRITVAVSGADDRAKLLTDGDRDTRWLTAQDGNAWIRTTFDRPLDVGRVDLMLAERSMSDYPRELVIESTDERGDTHVLYRGTPYPEFITGFVEDAEYPPMRIALPPNRSSSLTIRATSALPGRWWSVHELALWRRTR